MLTKAQFVGALKDQLPDVFTTKASADKAFDAFCQILADGIADSGVRLPNVGSFSLNQRAARTGRNPQTGAAIQIPAKKVVKFSAARTLTEKLG